MSRKSGRPDLTGRSGRRRGRPHRAHLGTPAYVHIEIDMSQVRSVIDDLLPVLRDEHSVILRSTVAPGTTDWVGGYIEQRRGFTVRGHLRLARAGADRREPLPRGDRDPAVHSRRRRRGSADRAAELFEVFGAEIVRTTPVQAELAKIWTNILRYAQFALPNLLMMECEQYEANVFDVIQLINHDYLRGGMARPGFTSVPAQGLRLLRGALERAGNAAGGVARARDRAAVPRERAEGASRTARCVTARRCGARPQLQAGLG